jgi:hypothetical protein
MKEKELSLLWCHGGATKIASGTYKVVMYPSWLWWWFLNVKKLSSTYGEGHNVAFGFLRWGKLRIRNQAASTLLDYSKSRWPFRNIRDYVRQVEDGYYIGKFIYIFPIVGWKKLFWFTLRKMEDS